MYLFVSNVDGIATSHWLLLAVVTLPLKKLLVSLFFPSHTHIYLPILDLTKYGSHVYVLVRRGELRASKIMAKRLMNNPKIVSSYVLFLALSHAAVDRPLEHRGYRMPRRWGPSPELADQERQNWRGEESPRQRAFLCHRFVASNKIAHV